MLHDLLVHIPSERSAAPVIACAVSLAGKLKAHLEAVAVGYESVTAELVVEAGAAVAAITKIERDRALEQAAAAIAIFEQQARQAGISYAIRTLNAQPAEAADALARLARVHDLTIVSQPDPDHRGFDDKVSPEVLFESGGPVLMVPYIHEGAFKADKIAIAWDGSRLAARAVRDAMPFLTAAGRVTVITVNAERSGPEASAAELAVRLGRCGVQTRIERLTSSAGNVHNAILSATADIDADLLVMGGYSHSRLQERILGGVTQGIFETMTLPTLMSH